MPIKVLVRGPLCGRFWINSGVLSRCFIRDPPELCSGCSIVLYVILSSVQDRIHLESFIGISCGGFYFILFYFISSLVYVNSSDANTTHSLTTPGHISVNGYRPSLSHQRNRNVSGSRRCPERSRGYQKRQDCE